MTTRFMTKNTNVSPSETIFDITFQRVHPHKKNAGSIGYKKIISQSSSSALIYFYDWANKRKSNIRFISIV